MLGKDWLTNDVVQTWALQYLQRRGLRHPEQGSAQALYDKLTRVGTVKENTPENREILRKLKGAWSQRKHRSDKERKKNSNYVFTTEAARRLDRLANDFQLTKINTLELIISDRLDQENTYKSAKRDDGAYKKRAAIFERHLDQALEELCRYKLLLGIAESDPLLTAAQHEEVKSLARSRKAAIIKELPPLPDGKRKKNKKPRTFTKHSSTATPSDNVMTATEQQATDHSEATTEPQAPDKKPSTAVADACPALRETLTPALAAEDIEQQPQEAPATPKDVVSTAPAAMQASSAHLNEHHNNADAQQQIQQDASCELGPETEPEPEPANAKTTNSSETITTQEPPEPPVTEQIDKDAITGADAPTTHERLDEVENQRELTEVDMEIRRLLQNKES
jgi:hypothetical protein